MSVTQHQNSKHKYKRQVRFVRNNRPTDNAGCVRVCAQKQCRVGSDDYRRGSDAEVRLSECQRTAPLALTAWTNSAVGVELTN